MGYTAVVCVDVSIFNILSPPPTHPTLGHTRTTQILKLRDAETHRLFEILGEQPWTVFRFLKTPHAELGGKTALDVLRTGRVDAIDTVVGVAKNQAAGAFS